MANQTRRNAAQRRRLADAFRGSAVSQAAFSKTHGISTTTLGRWLREFPGGPAFVEVVPSRAEVELVLEFDRGFRLRLPAGFDAAEVQRLVAALC